MNYAKGRQAKGAVYWEELKDNNIDFVVINCSAGEDDSIEVSRLVQEAYDNNIPAILETKLDPNYYKQYGGADDWPKNEEGLDEHVNAALKGMLHKTYYEYWIVCTDIDDIPWNATVFGHFASHMRHEINKKHGDDFNISIRMNKGWYTTAGQNMTWLQFKHKWSLAIAYWLAIEEGIIYYPPVLNHGTWEYMEYADGKYVFNGTREELYSRFGFSDTFLPPDTEPPPNEEPEPAPDITRMERAITAFAREWLR